MSRLRHWAPGREFTTVSPGRCWYKQDADSIVIVAVLSGAWGGHAFPEAGVWDDNVDQVWWVAIPKNAARWYEITEAGEFERISVPVWESAYWELGNKPHRAVGDGMRDGIFLGRHSVTAIEGVRLCNYRLVWYETPADRRAVRLWAQARARRSEAWRRRSKRLRHRMERGEWEKNPRRYRRYWRRRARQDARW
jgi:hypothetical protein